MGISKWFDSQFVCLILKQKTIGRQVHYQKKTQETGRFPFSVFLISETQQKQTKKTVVCRFLFPCF